MTDIRTDLVALIDRSLRAVVTDTEDLTDLSARVTALASLTGAAFAVELLALSRAAGESVSGTADYGRLTAADVTGDAAGFAQLVVTVMRLVACGRIDWPSRPAAIAAREALVADCETARAFASAFGYDALVWFNRLASTAIRLLSDIAATRAPMIQVETGISLPSCLLAYHLYGDARRAAGLVDIARSSTPMLMPASFEAIAR